MVVNLDGAKPWRPFSLDQAPTRLQTMLFSIVEPDPDQAIAYNDWYERDHQFDGGMSGAGWFSNRRWVATKRLKALRFPEGGAFPDLSVGSLCQIYWRQRGFARSSEQWALDQWSTLNTQHRIFTARRHFHSASYWHLSTAYHTDERVSVELALQHPFQGLAMLMVDDGCGDSSGDRTAAVRTIETIARDELLSERTPIAATFELLRLAGQLARRPPRTSLQGPVDQLVQLIFLRADPQGLWPAIKRYSNSIAGEMHDPGPPLQPVRQAWKGRCHGRATRSSGRCRARRTWKPGF